MIGIYKITNPVGEVYIGRSKNVCKRFLSHRCGNNVQPKLNSSFLQYGFYNHKLEIICECEEEDLHGFEALFIKKYNSVENGLNGSYGSGFYLNSLKKQPVEISIIYNSSKERRMLLTDEEFSKVKSFLKSIRKP